MVGKSKKDLHLKKVKFVRGGEVHTGVMTYHNLGGYGSENTMAFYSNTLDGGHSYEEYFKSTYKFGFNLPFKQYDICIL